MPPYSVPHSNSSLPLHMPHDNMKHAIIWYVHVMFMWCACDVHGRWKMEDWCPPLEAIKSTSTRSRLRRNIDRQPADGRLTEIWFIQPVGAVKEFKTTQYVYGTSTVPRTVVYSTRVQCDATICTAGLSFGGHSGIRGYSWNMIMTASKISHRRMLQICTMSDILGVIEVQKNYA